MAEEISNYEKMKTFIMALLDEFYPECGDIDGGTFQDLAEKHGILIPEIKHQPCGEFCKCNEVVYDEEWQDGVTCYHAAEHLNAGDGADAAIALLLSPAPVIGVCPVGGDHDWPTQPGKIYTGSCRKCGQSR